MERLKYGLGKTMSLEERKARKRALQKEWCKRHPDFVKAQNKHYAELYKKTNPHECICKYCGKTFYKPRSKYTVCPTCIAEKHYIAEMKRKTIVLKQEERKAEYKLILEMYKDGHTQEIIAETLGRSQSGISAILRRLNKRGAKWNNT